MGFLYSGQVRALAVTTLKRTATLPDVPTMDEAGLPGFEATTWHGLVAPAGTPRDVVETLHRAMSKQSKNVEVARNRSPRSASIPSATRRMNSPPISRRNSEMGGDHQGVRSDDD